MRTFVASLLQPDNTERIGTVQATCEREALRIARALVPDMPSKGRTCIVVKGYDSEFRTLDDQWMLTIMGVEGLKACAIPAVAF